MYSTSDLEQLQKYDELPPEEAIFLVWTGSDSHPIRHLLQQETVNGSMPLLARAIERLVEEYDKTSKQDTI